MNQRKNENQPLRVSVLSQMDPANPRTNSIADVRLCAGLAAQGHQVELVVPGITKPKPEAAELFATYGIDPSFQLRYLSVPSSWGPRGVRIFLPLLAHHALGALRPSRPPVVLSRDFRLLLPYAAAGRTRLREIVTAPWLHEFRGTRLERFVCASSTCVLATNTAILHDVGSNGVSNPSTFVTGNPVPQERVEFGRSCSREDARRRLGLNGGRPIVAYTGKLYLGMRELEHLLAAAARMSDCLFVFTGGQPPVIDRLTAELRERGLGNVHLAGMLANPEETRFYQQAADALITYYSRADHPYAHHNLPNKLPEYMTTGNLVVAADFPAVRDLLNPENSILVRPDDVDALTDALENAIRQPEHAAALATRAQRDIALRTSESVGAELGEFLSRLAAGERFLS
jgi:glycosyltransferase involved in cell wall biosynthesis